MQLSKADGADLREQVLAQIPLQLHCDPSSIVHRFLDVTPPGATRPEVIVMAVSRELVTRLMRAITDAKLEPVGMHSEFLAALAAYEHIHRRAEDIAVNTMYVDLGADTTTVSISHGRTLAFVRTIDIGGAALDQAIVAANGCSIVEARRLRSEPQPSVSAGRTMAERADPRRTGEFDERRAGQAAPGLASPGDRAARPVYGGVDLTESVAMIADEVRMCVRFHAAQFPQHKVDRVIFLGGESRHAAICAQIAAAVRLSWQVADPFARVSRTGQERVRGVEFTSPQPGWAVALGLCLSPTDL
jgi:Tfp pilus assembly PilM family ATPase